MDKIQCSRKLRRLQREKAKATLNNNVNVETKPESGECFFCGEQTFSSCQFCDNIFFCSQVGLYYKLLENRGRMSWQFIRSQHLKMKVSKIKMMTKGFPLVCIIWSNLYARITCQSTGQPTTVILLLSREIQRSEGVFPRIIIYLWTCYAFQIHRG
jgi:hypothetical protein